MHEIVTECQLPKGTFLARAFGSPLVDDRCYLLANCLVICIGKTVNEKAPVYITPGSKLISCERARNDDGCVVGVYASQTLGEF